MTFVWKLRQIVGVLKQGHPPPHASVLYRYQQETIIQRMAFRQPWVDIWIGIKGYSITRELRFVKVWNVASFSDIPEILKSPKGLWFQGSWKYVDVLMFSSLFDRTDFNYIIVIIRNLKIRCVYIYIHTHRICCPFGNARSLTWTSNTQMTLLNRLHHLCYSPENRKQLPRYIGFCYQEAWDI